MYIVYPGTRSAKEGGSVVVEALCYNPEGCGFETQ
jgi:hypothetical protein